ncbi:hypothetical protein AKJ51_01175 [candidate division MSBL1 archaeon SCGC-AAA382A20]|uniref:Chromosome segregation protein ScpA n=1 Tax=candidate division MSBL1 archaeon SCGC-AAA382A20 TaxID=1698280 RepID=A0A133VM59_9EURY|nr:hypothetical protein AKJ51_01175 [candidate division MSBL1 archaeon SCGC-AAA382A20]
MAVIFDQPFQILLELARDKKIDPWDVDIDKVANLYVEKIRTMERLDLRISGRALFSASTLLRMKADNPPYNGNGEEEDEIIEDLNFDMPELGPINIIRQNPQQITLSDLASSLQEALEKSESERTKKKNVPKAEDVVWELDDYHLNIEEHIEEFHKKISLLVTLGEKINFKQLLPEESKIEVCRNLLLSLFLASNGKINLHQKEHFEEIYIELVEPYEEENGN